MSSSPTQPIALTLHPHLVSLTSLRSCFLISRLQTLSLPSPTSSTAPSHSLSSYKTQTPCTPRTAPLCMLLARSRPCLHSASSSCVLSHETILTVCTRRCSADD